MDRSYKAHDLVHVYQSSKDGPLLDTFRQQPYSNRAFDDYIYKGVLYMGFTAGDEDGRTYILLDKPSPP